MNTKKRKINGNCSGEVERTKKEMRKIKNTDTSEQNRISGKEEIKMAKRMWRSHPFMKTSKIHLHVEQFSLETRRTPLQQRL